MIDEHNLAALLGFVCALGLAMLVAFGLAAIERVLGGGK